MKTTGNQTEIGLYDVVNIQKEVLDKIVKKAEGIAIDEHIMTKIMQEALQKTNFDSDFIHSIHPDLEAYTHRIIEHFIEVLKAYEIEA